jgi:hypothetical protein
MVVPLTEIVKREGLGELQDLALGMIILFLVKSLAETLIRKWKIQETLS